MVQEKAKKKAKVPARPPSVGSRRAYTSLSSKKAQDFAEKFSQVAPFPIKREQTDNGSEFHKYFDDYLSKKGGNPLLELPSPSSI